MKTVYLPGRVVALLLLASCLPSLSPAQEVVFSDTFDTEDLSQWRFNETPFENGAVTIDGGGIVDGALQLAITGISDFWGGFSLASERTFSATAEAPLTIEITRVADDGVGTTRTGAWITDQARTRYVFFSQNFGEGGWQYNRRIGEAGDNATGTGVNIEAFDPLDDDAGSHVMKFVGDGSTVELYLDDQLGAEVDFPVMENIIVEFGAYTRAVGDEAVGTFDDVIVRSSLPTGLPCVQISPANLNLLSGTDGDATVTVPKLFLAEQAAQVTLRSADPSVASLAGANQAGELLLNFAMGSENTRVVSIEAVGGGSTTIELEAAEPLCVANSLTVNVSSAFIRNPSFEDSPLPPAPGYGEIGEWEGGSGLNDGGPFGDNGAIPDRGQIAFIQGPTTLSQEISGLDPDQQYWLQFFYNARACCGGTIDLTVNFDDQTLGTITDVPPVGGTNPYHFFSAAFQPEDTNGTVELATAANGDASLVFDAVTIVERGEGQVAVANPSFEASGLPPAPGYISPAGLAGWTGTGNYGVNAAGGAFADNGSIPDQDLAAFLQEGASLSQDVVGFIPNAEYTLTVAANARSGNTPNLVIMLDDMVLLDEAVTSAGERNPYEIKTTTFVATAARHTISFAQTAEGDQTILLDDVRIEGESSGIPCLPIPVTQFRATIGQVDTAFTLNIPEEAVADGPLNLTVTNDNPDSIELEGADAGGSLQLTFEPGGALTADVNFTAVGIGSGMLAFEADKAICYTNDAVVYRVVSAPFRNPGFQSNAPFPFPTYGAVDDWIQTSNAGVNNAAGPFHDNGLIPDGSQVGFVQVSNSLQQTVANLEPGVEHWLQFFYNVRNCCGGTLSFQVLLDDTVLFEDADVIPVGAGQPYYFAFVRFVPESTQGVFQIAVTTDGDASLTFDAFTIVPRTPNDVLVVNPSFEMTGAYTLAFPGYMHTPEPTAVGGWTAAGAYGVNVSGEGPFADNGMTPSQDSALFLQGPGSSISQTITGLTAGETYALSYAYNARGANTPQLTVSIDGNVVHEVTVDPVGGANPYHTHMVEFQADGATADIVFSQTAEGDQTVLLDDVRVLSSTVVLPCVEVRPGDFALTAGETGTIIISVPPALIEGNGGIGVTASSSNPAVAALVGPSTLTFTEGSLEQTLMVEAGTGGVASIELSVEGDEACLSRDRVTIQVVRGIVRNGSFENNPRPAGVGYGNISSWDGEGGIGLNDAAGPFHDNGIVPDRQQIAFLQGAASISQTLLGLANGQSYWVQFQYNARNCCDGGTIVARVLIDEQEIGIIENVLPVGEGQPYLTFAARFTASSDTPVLRIATESQGDATLLLDAVTVLARDPEDVVVRNAGFEASGTPPAPGFLMQMAGWTIESGNAGVNVSGAGPFADNGTNPDQDHVVFLQGLTNISQSVSGLVPGQNYRLTFAYNARSGNTPRLVVAIDNTPVFEEDVVPVGGAQPYHVADIAFTPSSSRIELAFGQVTPGDQTVLLDDIRVIGEDVVQPTDLPLPSIALDGSNAILSWPDTETAAILQESPDLIDWEDSAAEVTLEGGINSATVERLGNARWFRLRE